MHALCDDVIMPSDCIADTQSDDHHPELTVRETIEVGVATVLHVPPFADCVISLCAGSLGPRRAMRSATLA